MYTQIGYDRIILFSKSFSQGTHLGSLLGSHLGMVFGYFFTSNKDTELLIGRPSWQTTIKEVLNSNIICMLASSIMQLPSF